MTRFILNNTEVTTREPEGMVLLDFIRYHQGLTGTKIGCREGDCGACTILVGELRENKLFYQSMTCCLMPIGNAAGKHIVTIEGINTPAGGLLNPLQQAMADEGATQCGFCTPGFVMSLAGFCLANQEPCTENAIAALDGNICRCTGYKSIERAAAKVNALIKERNEEEPTSFVARKKILPDYFSSIKERLIDLQQQTLGGKDKTDNHQPLPSNSAFLVGGGTDLYVQKHDEMKEASIHFTFDRPELNGIRKKDHRCLIGPSVTVNDLNTSPLINELFPRFAQYARLVSSTPIRNMATIAGNFINASPIGDFSIFFLALDAQVVLRDSTNQNGENVRTIPLRELYKGYKELDKKTEEYIEQIWFDIPKEKSYFHFEKVSKRTHLDIASVNTAISLTTDNNSIINAGLSAGGVGPVPMYLQKASDFLKGKKINNTLVQEAVTIARQEISPISDARGSKEYKSFLLGQLIKAHFTELFPELEIVFSHHVA